MIKTLNLIIKFILVSSIFVIISSYIRNIFSLRTEDQALASFYHEYYDDSPIMKEFSLKEKKSSNISYIAVLRIPKITLKQGLVDIDDPLNNVDLNIEILNNSTMPGENKSKLFLAAHSGNSNVSHFKNLSALQIGDEVYIDYCGITYQYEIQKISDRLKSDQLFLNLNEDNSYLILITCLKNSDKQLIIECKLVD